MPVCLNRQVSLFTVSLTGILFCISVTLHFFVDPASVISGLQNIIQNENSTACFTCVVVGIPRPSIVWSRAVSTEGNFSNLSNSTDITIIMTEDKIEFNQNRVNTTLEVRNLFREEDERHYRCLAVNDVENFIQARDRSTAFLTVHGE